VDLFFNNEREREKGGVSDARVRENSGASPEILCHCATAKDPSRDCLTIK